MGNAHISQETTPIPSREEILAERNKIFENTPGSALFDEKTGRLVRPNAMGDRLIILPEIATHQEQILSGSNINDIVNDILAPEEETERPVAAATPVSTATRAPRRVLSLKPLLGLIVSAIK